ncbi:MAG: OmpH family outer membrane protein [Bryobacteraceae bacterium]
MRKRLPRIAFVVLAAALPMAVLRAQSLKVAIVNAQKSVADTQEIKKAQADLATKYRPRQQDIEKLQNDLQEIQAQLKAPNLTPEKQSQLSADGTLKQKQLQRLSEDLQQDFNQDRADILTRAGQRMQEIIKKLAEEKGLDVVIDVSNALYYKPALDMTADATAAYDKAYPVSGSK